MEYLPCSYCFKIIIVFPLVYFYVLGNLGLSVLAATYNLKIENLISIGTKLVSEEENTHACLLMYI